MTIKTYKRLTITLSICCALLLMLCAYLFYNYGWLWVRVAFASEQTEIFEDMRTKALQSDAVAAAQCLEYVVTYYPSGTKQETGSLLDRMVERERARAVQDIVASLRTKTGKDLGETPDLWIKEYGRKRSTEHAVSTSEPNEAP